MHGLRYRITATSPLIITGNMGDTNMVSTAELIPGSSLLGVFANKFIKGTNFNGKKPHDDDRFRTWFLKGDLVFTNAYIVTPCENGMKRNFPLPFSIQNEKGNDDRCFDLLFYEANSDEDELQTVSETGYGRLIEDELCRETVKKSINFHHQRDSATGTSREGIIFNYESIDKGQIFEGNILGSVSNLEAFYDLFFDQDQSIDIYLGRSKNAQYGIAGFKVISQQPEEYQGEIESDREVREIANDKGEIALTMLSDTIVYNKDGFSTTERGSLEKYLQKTLQNDSVKIGDSFMKTGNVESFVSVWLLRRPSETCFLAGSCFLIEGLSDADSAKLKEIQKNGIGERRGEGFGRVVFGWQDQDKFTRKSNNTIVRKKPKGDIPSKTKDIIENIVESYLKKEIELKALMEVKEFNPRTLPTGHLISRLESFIVSQKDKKNIKEEFKKSIISLKGRAELQLERCRNEHKNLHDFLTKIKIEDITIDKVLNSSMYCKKAGELAHETGSPVHNYNNLESELFYIYFSTFFSAMRKIIKGHDNKEGKKNE
jgi:CRISPR-associated protein Csx10